MYVGDQMRKQCDKDKCLHRETIAILDEFLTLTIAILAEYLTLTIAILDEFLTLMYQHRRAPNPKCVKVEDKFPFPKGDSDCLIWGDGKYINTNIFETVSSLCFGTRPVNSSLVKSR